MGAESPAMDNEATSSVSSPSSGPSSSQAHHPPQPSSSSSSSHGGGIKLHRPLPGGGEVDSTKDHCNHLGNSLVLLRGPSDEERFAGLMMLAKLLNSRCFPPPMVIDVRRQILEAVEVQFLHRLLRSTAPPQSSSFQVVAVTVIACLCQDRSLLPQLRRLLGDVVAVLEMAEEPQLLEDCTFIINGIASCIALDPTQSPNPNPPDFPFQVSQALSRLAMVMVRFRQRGPPSHSPLPPPQPPQAPGTPPGSNDPLARFYETAIASLEQMASYPEVLSGVSDEALVALSQQLESEMSAFKFRLLRVIALILGSRRQVKRGGVPPAKFGQHMRSALVQLLHGAVREDKRDWALRALVDMFEVAGESWALEPSTPPPSSSTTGQHSHILPRGTSAAFFVHILTTEVRMGLEEALAIWEVPHEEPSLEAVREKRLDRIQRIVLVCLGAIEAVLKFLCGFHHDEEQGGEGESDDDKMRTSNMESDEEDQGHWDVLPGPILLKMRDSFHCIIMVLIRFIKEGGLLLEKNDLPELEARSTLLPLMKACLRLLGVYMSEDERALPNATVVEVLNAAMSLVRYEQKSEEAMVVDEKVAPTKISATPSKGEEDDEERDITPFLFPLMNKLLSDVEGGDAVGVAALVDQGVHALLCRYVQHHHMSFRHPGRICEALLNLQELMMRGAQLPCQDQPPMILAEYPGVLDLLPPLAHTARVAMTHRTKESYRLAHYLAWFIVNVLKLYPPSLVQTRLPKTGEAYQALVQTLDYLHMGQDSEGLVEEERKQELMMLKEGIREGLTESAEFFQ